MLFDDVTSALVFLSVFLILWLTWKYQFPSQPYPRPPGPPYSLPIIGHLYLMSKDPQKTFREWKKQYGDMFSFYCGNRLIVVLSSYRVLKEAFVKHGDVFSHRPYLFLMDFMIEGNVGLVLSSGDVWKEQRKVALEILRELGLGKNILAEKILAEAALCLKTLESKNDSSFDPHQILHVSVANIICSIVFGKRYSQEDSQFQKYMAALESNVRDLGRDSAILNFFPFLRFLPGDLFHLKRLVKNKELIQNIFLKGLVEEHLKEHNENCVNDFISAYIREMKKREAAGVSTSLHELNLTAVIGDLFAAGMETTATTLCWAFAFFLHYPEVQEKCYQEIISVVGSERMPTMQDKLLLPYVEAMTLEVLRKANIVPFGVQHTVSENVIFRDTFIPKDAIILPFMESVLSDKTVWAEPDEFRPERFLSANGKCVCPDEFIPFSLGRRVCLGKSLAQMELFLFMSAMIQRFQFLPPEDGVLPSLNGILGITLNPEPFNLRAILRK